MKKQFGYRIGIQLVIFVQGITFVVQSVIVTSFLAGIIYISFGGLFLGHSINNIIKIYNEIRERK